MAKPHPTAPSAQPVRCACLALALCALTLACTRAEAADNAAPDGTFHLERGTRGVRRIEVVSAAGDVRVRAQRADSLVVDGARTLGGGGCRLRLTGKAPTLRVEAQDPSGRPCSVELQVRLPQAVALSVRAGIGNVYVSGLRGALELELAEGSAVVGGTFPRCDAKLGQGSLSVQGLAGPARLTLERGNLQMYAAPQPGGEAVAIDFRVAAGNATLESSDAAANLQVHSNAGEVRSTLEEAGPQARVRVTGELGAGNFTASRGR